MIEKLDSIRNGEALYMEPTYQGGILVPCFIAPVCLYPFLAPFDGNPLKPTEGDWKFTNRYVVVFPANR